MSSIWSLIKEGKEKLEKTERHEIDIEVLKQCGITDFQDEDILELKSKGGEKENKKKSLSNKSKVQTVALPEWLNDTKQCDIRKLKDYPVYELHEELFYLDKWLQPTNLDKFARETVLEDVKRVIQKAMPEAEVYPFGSFLTNL